MFKNHVIRTFATLAIGTALSLSTSIVANATAQSTKKLTMPAGITSSYGGDLLTCASAGNCVTVGRAAAGSTEALFAAQEVAGVWKPAVRLVFATAPSAGSIVTPTSLYCVSVANCLLTVTYNPTRDSAVAVRFEMTAGNWATGQRFYIGGTGFTGNYAPSSPPSMGQMNGGCWSAKNCIVSALYRTKLSDWFSFTAIETNGVWGATKQMVAPYAQSDGVMASDIACVTNSGCVLTGRYYKESGDIGLFAAQVTSGTIGTAEDIPTPANSNASISIGAFTCTTLNNCAGTGTYSTKSSSVVQFVVNRSNGTWATASQVKMPAGWVQKNNPDSYFPPKISCANDGTCIATSWGYMGTSLAIQRPMTVLYSNGTWGTAQAVKLPAGAKLPAQDPPPAGAVACYSATRCLVMGGFRDAANKGQIYLSRMTSAGWQVATTVPMPADNSKTFAYGSVGVAVCFSNATCTASGSYNTIGDVLESFVVDNIAI